MPRVLLLEDKPQDTDDDFIAPRDLLKVISTPKPIGRMSRRDALNALWMLSVSTLLFGCMSAGSSAIGGTDSGSNGTDRSTPSSDSIVS